jgi:hypothetical protein
MIYPTCQLVAVTIQSSIMELKIVASSLRRFQSTITLYKRGHFNAPPTRWHNCLCLTDASSRTHISSHLYTKEALPTMTTMHLPLVLSKKTHTHTLLQHKALRRGLVYSRRDMPCPTRWHIGCAIWRPAVHTKLCAVLCVKVMLTTHLGPEISPSLPRDPCPFPWPLHISKLTSPLKWIY